MMMNPRGQQIEAPLPTDCVELSRPCAATGIDFAVPLCIKVGSEMCKSYISLFTCVTIRAVHLVLCTNMITVKLLMALQRFFGRRGLPHTIYADNAKTFQAANFKLIELCKQLFSFEAHKFLALNGIVWKYIAPRAACCGGWSERMIGTCETLSAKGFRAVKIHRRTLEHHLYSIEPAVNSRSIKQGEDSVALTPAYFLNGEKLVTIATGTEHTARQHLTKELRLKQKLSDDFWKRWTKEYLLELRNFHEVQRPVGKTAQLCLGNVVLIKEDVRPRHL